jgi:hypothetical protein
MITLMDLAHSQFASTHSLASDFGEGKAHVGYGDHFYATFFSSNCRLGQIARIMPVTPSNEPGTSSAINRRAGSTGPGMLT